MSKIQNPAVLGASGTFDGTIVYRRVRGKTVMAGRPKQRKKGKRHETLVAQSQKFLEASMYAKQQMKDPVSKAEYAEGIGGSKHSAFAVAMTDYLKPPTVHFIDATLYKGSPGDIITVKATDDFKVAKLEVSVIAADGTVIESGVANPAVAIFCWDYATTVANPGTAGCKIKATAFDKAGNKASLDVTV
jgi:hypothetical protein